MILKKFEIFNLFNLYNYDYIEFKEEQNIIILFGPNGTGKTTILNIIHYFRTEDFQKISKINFEKLKFYFLTEEEKDSIKILEIQNLNSKELRFKFYNKINGDPYLDFLLDVSLLNKIIQLKLIDKIKILPEDLEKSNKSLNRIYFRNLLAHSDENIFIRGDDNILMNEEKLSPRIYYDLSNILSSKKGFENFKQFFEELSQIINFFKCYYISAQRLDIRTLNSKEKSTKEFNTVIENKSDILFKKIQEKFNDYLKISQTQDKALINRVIDSIESKDKYTFNEVLEDLDKIEKVQNDYAKAGLDTSEISRDIKLRGSLEKSKDWEDSTQSETLYRILKNVIFSDGWEKLNVFTNLYQKIDLFQSIVNCHLSNKVMEIHHNRGFIIKNKITEKEISLNLLSSGEMNLIILFFSLIFETEPNTLILIDEPEISLHIEWQMQFIDNLLKINESKISELKNLRFIIATHAPQIIHDHHDLTIELK